MNIFLFNRGYSIWNRFSIVIIPLIIAMIIRRCRFTSKLGVDCKSLLVLCYLFWYLYHICNHQWHHSCLNTIGSLDAISVCFIIFHSVYPCNQVIHGIYLYIYLHFPFCGCMKCLFLFTPHNAGPYAMLNTWLTHR